MTTTIQNLSDLQDRRIMMDKKLPPYGYAFVILTGLFMIFLVIWSTQTNRIYVSQNSGVVQAANKTYIMSSYSGSITELNIAEGTYVNEGDLIAHIKSTDLDMQQDSIQSQLDIYKKQKSQYEKLVKSIQDDKNYFSETDIVLYAVPELDIGAVLVAVILAELVQNVLAEVGGVEVTEGQAGRLHQAEEFDHIETPRCYRANGELFEQR